MKTSAKIFITLLCTVSAAAAAAAAAIPKAKRSPKHGKKQHVVTINCNLTPEEYDTICGEFCLKPDNVMMEYIYRRGGERFGVRLAPGELRSDDIAEMFTMPIIKDRAAKLLKNRSTVYPSSDSKVVQASSFTPSAQRGNDYKIHIFNVDGCEYMEIEKAKTENIGIFLHS